MANAMGSPRRIWLIPIAIVLVGAVCTLLLWYAAERALLKSSRTHTAQVHEAAHQHLGDTLNRLEAAASLLAQSLADSGVPHRTLEISGDILLARFPELTAVEHYAAETGQGPDSWRQVQLIARGGGTRPNQDFSPTAVPHWRRIVERAWDELRPGVTALAGGSGALSEAITSRPTVHLFWPAVKSQASPIAGVPEAPQLLGLMLDPERLLASLPESVPGAAVEFQIFDLNSQSADPIAKASGTAPGADDTSAARQLTYEDTLALADRRWLLRTTFDVEAPPETQGLLQAVLVFGAALTFLTALLCLRMADRLRHYADARSKTLRRWKNEHLAVQNAAIEKGILSRALNDSEQRTRDFVDLSNAFSCELDEDWRIGFVSSQIASILDRPPVDLANRSLLDLVPENDRESVAEAFRRCARERQTVRIETALLHPDGQSPVSMNIRPVTDGTNRCMGFRAVGWCR